MPFVLYLLLLICFLLSGWGVLTLFRLRLKAAYAITLSLLLGVAVASVVPFFLQLLDVPLTPFSVFLSLCLVALALNFAFFRRFRREGWSAVRNAAEWSRFEVRAYEVPFLAVFVFLAFVSIWRCYYLPPTSRDVLSGPEAIAQFAVSEHTMLNSFFNIDLWSTNNQFKSPFLISLQLIYKMAGFPFGQVWLSIVSVCFTVFLYHAIKEKQHPIVAGILLLLFMMSPELYAYTFMILYDYSNMVYFFISVFLLFRSFRNKTPACFWMSGLLMGIATYIRAETLILAFLFLPLILFVFRKDRMPVRKMALSALLYYLPVVGLYYLSGPLWLHHYLPVHYSVGEQVNRHLGDLSPLFQRYSDIITHLIGSHFGVELWGYIYYVGGLLFVAEFFSPGRYNKEARNWLYAMLVLYLGLGALGFALPLMNLNETTKRGLFKLLPVVVLYLANNDLLLRLSAWLGEWEHRIVPAASNAPSKGNAAGTGKGASNASSKGKGASAAYGAPTGKAQGNGKRRHKK